jgi:hypothetical protein
MPSDNYRLQRWLKFKGRRVGALSRLAKQLGYATAGNPEFKRRLLLLSERKSISIQQGGYVGDSMHHIKLVSMSDRAYDLLENPRFKEPIIENVPSELPQLRFNGAGNFQASAIQALSEAVKKVKIQVTRFAQGIPMRVIKHGKSYYLLLPVDLVNYYSLRPGDVVTARPIELKRLITEE